MTATTQETVLQLLQRGKTVAWVCDATQWPRRNILTVASRAGLLHDHEADVVYRPLDAGDDPDRPEDRLPASASPAPATTRPAPPPPAAGRCSHAVLLGWSDEHGTARAKAAARQVEALLTVIAQERRKEQDKAQAKAERERARAQADRLELELARARATAKGHTFDEDQWRAGRERQRQAQRTNTGRRNSGSGRDTDYDPHTVRRWARDNGIEVPMYGRYLPRHVVDAYNAAHARQDGAA